MSVEFYNLCMFVCACVGTTSILVTSFLLEPVRDRLSSISDGVEYFVNCSMCTGFWVGAIASLFFGLNIYIGAVTSSLFSWVTVNFVTTLVSVGTYFDSEITEEDE